MDNTVQIETLDRPGKFLDLQRNFYRGDPHYVPPLTVGERWHIDRRKNPYFQHGAAEFFVARRGGRVVGRISASRDQLHDELHGDRVGFFGHFEAADQPAAHALLDRAASWQRDNGGEVLRGPVDLSTNYRCGLLVEGEPGPPVMQMPYTPPTYPGYLESYGLQKAKDLIAFYAWTADLNLPRMQRFRDRILKRTGATIRRTDLGSDLQTLWGLYNQIWEKNWGFAPMSEAEFLHHAKDMKMIARVEMLQLVEIEERPVGFAVALPDVNIAVRACNGRLLPFGWWKFLRALKKTGRARTIMMGLVPELRNSGLDAALILRVIEEASQIGIIESEASWVLEDNEPMVRALQNISFQPYRRYRIYERELT